MKKPDIIPLRGRTVTWRDCGNALYEDRQESIEALRKRYRCTKFKVRCADCPVFREKIFINKEKK
jgi:hypothetical protein